MEDKVGEEFDGMISSVTNFGMFVELPNTIEGLVHVSYMTDDYYHYDERQYAMIGEKTGNVFRIGDEITVRVINVNKDEHDIDFEIVGMKNNQARRGRQEQPRIVKVRSHKKDTKNKGPQGNSDNGDWSTRPPKAKKKKKKSFANTPKNKRSKKRK